MLQGKQVYLRLISSEDVSEEYVKWMNDYEVTRYTESKYIQFSRANLIEYVNRVNDESNYMFAVFANESEKHIGNIKLGNINWIHRYGDVGLIIGDKEYYGKGIATESISLVSEFAFNHLNLHKIWCGIYKNNVGSIRAFEKSGYEVYATEKSKYFFEGRYVDAVYMHKFNQNIGIEVDD